MALINFADISCQLTHYFYFCNFNLQLLSFHEFILKFISHCYQGGSARRNAYENIFCGITDKQTIALVFNGDLEKSAIIGMHFVNLFGSYFIIGICCIVEFNFTGDNTGFMMRYLLQFINVK